ncbi:MAG: hypothetical protein SGJ11_15125, partial [Phycisphaerae bacterium]|nr:hypothetical protein [Phycisphaerae bacterium]
PQFRAAAFAEALDWSRSTGPDRLVPVDWGGSAGPVGRASLPRLLRGSLLGSPDLLLELR